MLSRTKNPYAFSVVPVDDRVNVQVDAVIVATPPGVSIAADPHVGVTLAYPAKLHSLELTTSAATVEADGVMLALNKPTRHARPVLRVDNS